MKHTALFLLIFIKAEYAYGNDEDIHIRLFLQVWNDYLVIRASEITIVRRREMTCNISRIEPSLS